MHTATIGGHITRVVFRVVFGFVGMLVLLIHHDQSEVFKWGKDGRARADHQIDLPVRDTSPRIKAFPFSK